MGQKFSLDNLDNSEINYIGYEHIQDFINVHKFRKDMVLITTNPVSNGGGSGGGNGNGSNNGNNMNGLIRGTIQSVDEEERIINRVLESGKMGEMILFIYGKNCSDTLPVRKAQQFIDLGFRNIYVYLGGLFEWALLADLYGLDEFPFQNGSIIGDNISLSLMQQRKKE
jgi:hypothetical protein